MVLNASYKSSILRKSGKAKNSFYIFFLLNKEFLEANCPQSKKLQGVPACCRQVSMASF
jgi:hypothetical protein